MSDFDEKNETLNTPNLNRPRLKKVKKPIKRPIGSSDGNMTPHKSIVPGSLDDTKGNPYVPVSHDAFNLDEYLVEGDKTQSKFVQDEDLYAEKTNKFSAFREIWLPFLGGIFTLILALVIICVAVAI